MPRANRYHVPGCVWHITHRCHKREFLLKFARDRRTWQRWLYEAKKRYGLTVLNYMVTSNHIHLLVLDGDDDSIISRSLQLVAGRTAQEYNLRKRRRGAFWEDRYHATAVQSGKHLQRCMGYIDRNMVRAGVVSQPSEWQCCGYTAIQQPPQRYQVIDRQHTAQLLGVDADELALRQREWVRTRQAGGGCVRDERWIESIASGDRIFVEDIIRKLGVRSRHRRIIQEGDACIVREASAAYTINSKHETDSVSIDNTCFWEIS